MTYAKVVDGQLAAFPYLFGHFREDYPNTMVDWSVPTDLAPFGVVLPIEDPEPALAPGEYSELAEPVLVGDVWTRPRMIIAVTPERLADHEAVLHRRIDQEAGAFRTNFITDVPGQAETYSAKAAEAARFAADPAGDYPFLQAEAQATGRSIVAVAAEVGATAAQWTQLGARIEGARMAAKRTVSICRAAGDWAAMDAAAVVDWPALLG